MNNVKGFYTYCDDCGNYYFDSNENRSYVYGDVVESKHGVRYLCTKGMSDGFDFETVLIFPRKGDMVEVGDVDKQFGCCALTEGKNYEVLEARISSTVKSYSHSIAIVIKNDLGQVTPYNANRFTTRKVNPGLVRKNKIKRFLENEIE